jgi:tetrahydromethanopterin S-methyltransferase subunit D
MLSVIMLNGVVLSVVMLSVLMLIAIMLSVIMLNVVMLSVVAPIFKFTLHPFIQRGTMVIGVGDIKHLRVNRIKPVLDEIIFSF